MEDNISTSLVLQKESCSERIHFSAFSSMVKSGIVVFVSESTIGCKYFSSLLSQQDENNSLTPPHDLLNRASQIVPSLVSTTPRVASIAIRTFSF